MIILRLPDGTCRLASLPTPCSGDTVVMAAATMCGVTRDAVYALHDGMIVDDRQILDDHGCGVQMVDVVMRLRGGKGGFGNLMKTMKVKIKSKNKDACRSLDGRRFRNADAEKKISEWKARRETGEAAEEKTEEVMAKKKKEDEELALGAHVSNVRLEKFAQNDRVLASAVASSVQQVLRKGNGDGTNEGANDDTNNSRKRPDAPEGGDAAAPAPKWLDDYGDDDDDE